MIEKIVWFFGTGVVLSEFCANFEWKDKIQKRILDYKTL